MAIPQNTDCKTNLDAYIANEHSLFDNISPKSAHHRSRKIAHLYSVVLYHVHDPGSSLASTALKEISVFHSPCLLLCLDLETKTKVFTIKTHISCLSHLYNGKYQSLFRDKTLGEANVFTHILSYSLS